MAGCHDTLGHDEAQKLYERVKREYPEQKDAVAVAEDRLASYRTPSVPTPAQRGVASVQEVLGGGGGRGLLPENIVERLRNLASNMPPPEVRTFGRLLAPGDTVTGTQRNPSVSMNVNTQGALPPSNTPQTSSERATQRFLEGGAIYSASLDRQTGKAQSINTVRLQTVSPLASASSRASLSPDGKTVAYLSSSGDVTMLSVESGEARGYSVPLILHSLLWFPDNKNLLITRRIDPGIALGRFEVSSGIYTELVRDLPNGWVAKGISPDGMTVFAALDRSDSSFWKDEDASILVVPLRNGAQPRVLVLPTNRQTIGGLALSPDGKTLAVSVRSMRGQPLRIFRIGVDGAGYQELYVDNDPSSFPIINVLRWTPDGRTLLFGKVIEKQDPDTRNPEGKPMRDVVSGSGGKSQILGLSIDGGAPVFTGLEAQGLNSFDVSPDGSRLIIAARSASLATSK
jgi:Tol biopolymer transport system component